MKKIMKYFKTTIYTILLLTTIIYLLPTITQAQQDVRGALDNIEAERREKVEKLLLLDLPEISDNPNHIITFKDPSDKGIKLEIDGQGFKEIKSPYTLPSLGLGRHLLIFKFHDDENTEQTLERTFTIIPRAPIISPPELIDNSVKISGTAMPNSEVDLFLINKANNFKSTVNVSQEGEWEKIFEEEIGQDTHTIIAVTRSRGFGSHYSEPLVFNIDKEEIQEIKEEGPSIYFSFSEINFKDFNSIVEIFKSNKDLLTTLFLFTTSGFVIGCLLISTISKISQRKSKAVLKEMLLKKTKGNSNTTFKFKKEEEEIEENNDEEVEEETEKNIESIKQKFNILQNKEEEEEIEEEEENEEEEEIEEEEEKKTKKKTTVKKGKMLDKAKNVEKSISKEEFLEKYKEFDPDDEDGIEIKKRNIKLTLNSKD